MTKIRKPTQTAILHFTERLAALLPSGITLLKALQILAKQPGKKKRQLPVAPLIAALEQGQELSIATQEAKFPNTYSRILAVGESTGQLPTVLKQLHALMLQQSHLKRMWMKALLYPLIVLIVALGITTVLLVWVIPKIEGMFTSFGQELPMMTQMVLHASNWLRTNIVVMLTSALILTGAAWFSISRYQRVKRLWHHSCLKLPIIGSFLHLKSQSHSFQILYTCVHAGLTLDQALTLTGNAIPNLCYQHVFQRANNDLMIGQSLHHSLESQKLLSDDTIQLIAVAEDSAQLESMFQFLSERNQNQLEHQLQQLSQLLEPLLMLFMGIIVGGLVIAMYLPVFTMGSVM